jgi:hypothetical protein
VLATGLLLACRGANTGLARYARLQNTLSAAGLVPVGELRRGGSGEAIAVDHDGGCAVFAALLEADTGDHIKVTVRDQAGHVLATSGEEPVVQVCSSEKKLKVTFSKGAGAFQADGYLGKFATDGARKVDGQQVALGNGTCASPFVLRVGNMSGNTRQGREEQDAQCVRSTSKELVYVVDVLERSRFRAALDARFDSVLYLRGADCEDGKAEVACNDDAPGGAHGSLIDETLEAGKYHLIVDGSSGEQGSFVLQTELTQAKTAEEACAGAVALERGARADIDLSGQDAMGVSCVDRAPSGEALLDLKLKERSRIRARLELAGDLGEAVPVLSVRRVCKDASSELACVPGEESHASLLRTLDAGSYTLVADATRRVPNLRGAVTVDWVSAAGLAQAGDTCAAALPIPKRDEPFAGDTFAVRPSGPAKPTPGVDVCGNASGGRLYYHFDVAQKSQLVVELAEQEGDHVLMLQAACDGPALACSAKLDMGLEPGSYVLSVGARDADPAGTFVGKVQIKNTARQHALCKGSPALAIGQTLRAKASAGAADVDFGLTMEPGSRVFVRKVRLRKKLYELRANVEVYLFRGCNDTDILGKARMGEDLESLEGDFLAVIVAGPLDQEVNVTFLEPRR